MSIAVTYQLPPYVARIANTHYRLDRGYTPYKLQDLGNYPLGVYSISGVNNLFNGNVPAVSSTNNSVTFLYSTSRSRQGVVLGQTRHLAHPDA